MAVQRMHMAETALIRNKEVEQLEKQLAEMRKRHATLQDQHDATMTTMLESHAEVNVHRFLPCLPCNGAVSVGRLLSSHTRRQWRSSKLSTLKHPHRP